ncbi:hypothetical protein [Laspinema palackyanum]
MNRFSLLNSWNAIALTCFSRLEMRSPRPDSAFWIPGAAQRS